MFSHAYVLYTVQEAERSKREKAKHSQWRNYDDLNEYFWYGKFYLQYELLSYSFYP